jgi:perosamine synthetase
VARKITLGHLQISEQGKEYVGDVLNSNRLSRGKYTEKFEHDFSDLHGCEHGIFCNSGTSALQITLAALKEIHGYKDQDEVIVPATTFIATSNIVLQNNMKPVFVDVDPFTFNIDPAKIQAAITERTRVIIPVHLFGLPADMPAIMEIAKKNGLQVIEDSCECMFAEVDGRRVGNFGDAACFSTYIAHIIVGGVGGLVTTNDSRIADICRSLLAHGRDTIYTNIDADDSVDASLQKEMIDRRYRMERVGYSYRATELEAAIALSELERWESNIAKRQQNAHKLWQLLNYLPMLHMQAIPETFEHVYMMFPMVLDSEYRLDKFLLYLEQNGIETRYLFPLLSQPIYQKLFPNLDNQYPVAQHLAQHGLFLGCHQGMNSEDMEYVSKIIHAYFDSPRHHLQ